MKCPYGDCDLCTGGDIVIEEGASCENCGYEGIPLSLYSGSPTYRKVWALCGVCANTFLSKAAIYPKQCKDVSLYQSIGWIANKILEGR